ncbi:unnamed protein product [Cuscuta campestris]|uniref:DNA-directed RNA polymerase III subunit n=2 Tax=Cuscuta sect. Cleistogrammica TaxID=1824901 RepID=A0A484M9R1_9ASTE|nr:hypothetical protein DM860_002272 [Cuscuta australis]VFQ85482.1 unnamed protein product [Cuscuta campestris]
MAFRGRGRGRGGYGGGFKRAKEEPFELFPAIDDETLGKATMVFPHQEYAASAYSKIMRHCRSSPYYIRDETGGGLNETKSTDIEQFSDMNSNRSRAKSELSDFITISAALYPAETAKRKTMMIRRAKKRVRWSQDADLQDLDFERFEQDSDGEEGKKNDSEDDDDDEEDGEENVEEDEDSFDEDDDYMKNEDFDDDEDDFNMDDDPNDDEGTYD